MAVRCGVWCCGYMKPSYCAGMHSIEQCGRQVVTQQVVIQQKVEDPSTVCERCVNAHRLYDVLPSMAVTECMDGVVCKRACLLPGTHY